MFKKIVLISLLFSSFLYSQEIDRQELESSGDTDIKFEDYTGPENEGVNTGEEIKAIGRELAKKSTLSDVNHAAYGSKYSIDILTDDSEGLSAVVFSINESAKVDRIANVRRVLEGYLETSFGYKSDDSETLSRFVTVYNAVYRNNIDFFKSKYKKVVLDFLDESKVGVSTSYKEWPGYTQIVIPFTNDIQASSTTALKPSELVDNNTMAQIEKEGKNDGKDITDKQNMVGLLNETSEKQKEENAQKEKELNSKQEKNEKAKSQAQEEAKKAQEEAKKAQEEAKKAQEEGNKQAQEEANKKEEEANKKEEEANKKEEEANKKEDELLKEEDKLKEDKQAQKENEAKSSELTGEVINNINEKISQEQEGGQEVEKERTIGKTTYFVDTRFDEDSKLMLSDVILIEEANGKQTSEDVKIKDIVNRTLVDKNDGSTVALILDDMDKKMAHLSLIKSDTLEEMKKTEGNIYIYSMVVTTANSVFAITFDDKDSTYHISRYNQNLDLIGSSIVKIDPYTYIKVSENKILVKDIEGDIVVLDKDTLRVALEE